ERATCAVGAAFALGALGKDRKIRAGLTAQPFGTSPGLEVDADGKVKEARLAVLGAGGAERFRGLYIQARIVEFHVIEDVHCLHPEGHAGAFSEVCFLCQARIHVPAREAAHRAAASPLVTKEQPSEGGGWIEGGPGQCAYSSFSVEVVVRGGA